MKEIEMDRIKKLARFTQKIKTEFLIGKNQKQFIQNLRDKDINVVVDVRWWSVFPVYFAPINLRILLMKNDIEYLRFQALGNPSVLRKQARDNFELAKELYLEYIINDLKARQQFVELFKKLRFKKNYCLICYCKTLNPQLCHRFWLREALINAKRLKLGFEGNYVLNLKPMPIIQEAN